MLDRKMFVWIVAGLVLGLSALGASTSNATTGTIETAGIETTAPPAAALATPTALVSPGTPVPLVAQVPLEDCAYPSNCSPEIPPPPPSECTFTWTVPFPNYDGPKTQSVGLELTVEVAGCVTTDVHLMDAAVGQYVGQSRPDRARIDGMFDCDVVQTWEAVAVNGSDEIGRSRFVLTVSDFCDPVVPDPPVDTGAGCTFQPLGAGPWSVGEPGDGDPTAITRNVEYGWTRGADGVYVCDELTVTIDYRQPGGGGDTVTSTGGSAEMVDVVFCEVDQSGQWRVVAGLEPAFTRGEAWYTLPGSSERFGQQSIGFPSYDRDCQQALGGLEPGPGPTESACGTVVLTTIGVGNQDGLITFYEPISFQPTLDECLGALGYDTATECVVPPTTGTIDGAELVDGSTIGFEGVTLYRFPDGDPIDGHVFTASEFSCGGKTTSVTWITRT